MARILKSIILFCIPLSIWGQNKGIIFNDGTQGGVVLEKDLKVSANSVFDWWKLRDSTCYWRKDANGIYYQSASIERMRVFEDGRVSIGSFHTGSKLSLLGGIRADSIILAGGNGISSDGTNLWFNVGGVTYAGLTSSTFTVSGLKLGASAGVGKVLTSLDAFGNAGWQTPATGYTGTGTTNTLSMFTGATTIGNSPLSNSGTLLTSTSRLKLPSGAASTPSIMLGATNGFFDDGGVAVGVENVKRLGISNKGHLYLNSTNTFIGQAGNASTVGYQNVGVGGSVMSGIRGGIGNAALGYFALDQDTSGNYNFAFGAYSQYWNFNGSDNVSIGSLSLYNIRSSRNIAIGSNSGYSYTLGEHNTSIGYNSGGGNQLGSKNIAIGYQASADNGIYNYNNSIVIGNDIYNTSSASNKITIGNASNNLVSFGEGKFNLPLRNYTMGDDKKFLTYRGGTNDFELAQSINVYNTDGVLTSNRVVTNGGNDLALNGTGNFYIGTSAVPYPAKAVIYNTESGKMSFRVDGLSAALGIGISNGGTSNISQTTSFTVQDMSANAWATFTSTGLAMASGKKGTGGVTSGASGADWLPVAQAINQFTTPASAISQSSASWTCTLPSTSYRDFQRVNMTSSPTAVTITLSGGLANGEYYLALYNVPSNTNVSFSNNVKSMDGNTFTFFNSASGQLRFHFIYDGTNYYLWRSGNQIAN
jgi:hypothetical protein